MDCFVKWSILQSRLEQKLSRFIFSLESFPYSALTKELKFLKFSKNQKIISQTPFI
ncbi:hypothetical protein LEP1GSC044_2555 [Leptospira kirschneri serovar Grippotyphosa str. RM52]|nr:hypothetical protein LEP1GSC044_2555 [Leptospira kirschneri serovar Grippotyphosa str. RM52]EKR07522.1 hypothetical protein LEP1GSC122_2954 [Leptospira kirschneri serovar Valbuzzi str. 200702274]EMK01493.1 hypothetical protein LEP1GSC176_2863 [Leptospira kirschneri str. MMD1493]